MSIWIPLPHHVTHRGNRRDDALLSFNRPCPGPVPDWGQWLSNPEQEAAETTSRHRRCTKTGRPRGGPSFVASLEETLGRSLRPLKRGPKPRLQTGDEGQAGPSETNAPSGVSCPRNVCAIFYRYWCVLCLSTRFTCSMFSLFPATTSSRSDLACRTDFSSPLWIACASRAAKLSSMLS